MARVINKQLQKTSGADVLLSRKKIRKTLGGMAAAPPPPLTKVLYMYVRGLRYA